MLRRTHRFDWLLGLFLVACSSSENTDPDDGSNDGDGGTKVDKEECRNGKKDGNETDVDCGGSCQTKCTTKQTCKTASDCDDDLQCTKAVCSPKSSTDGVQNGNETDIDCGGDAPPCADGKKCQVGGDCSSQLCKSNVCQPPSSTDGIKNGTETDVDCGGGAPTNAPACALGKACATHDDCTSEACSESTKTCVADKSCAVHLGGDTCGPNGDENCCTRLPVPTANNVQLDKYVVTAGRMRAFVERTGGNIRGWIQGNRPSWWSASWDQYLPTQLEGGAQYASVNEQLGAGNYGKVEDANRGCWVGTGKDQIGARTYWLPQSANDDTNSTQLYSKEDLDPRALNCVTAYMLAALCAWDGGRLPTRAELDAAWGNKKYPWGASPDPAGWPYAYDDETTANVGDTLATGDIEVQTSCKYTGPNGACDPARASFKYNYWGGLVKKGNDYSLYIPPPGKFPTGNGPYGHADLAGLVFNYTSIDGSGRSAWSKNGSWQGHRIPFVDRTFAATNKYWSTGGRCAR